MRLPVRRAAVGQGDARRDERDDEQAGGRAEQDAQAPRPCRVPPHASLGERPLPVAGGHGGVEERDLDRGEVGAAARPPLERRLEASPAVQLALGAAEGLPALRRRHEVPHDPHARGVLVEPGLQARPRVRERLVSDLDSPVVGGEQARTDEAGDDTVAAGVAAQVVAGQAVARGRTVGDGATSRSISDRQRSRSWGSRCSYSWSADRATAPGDAPGRVVGLEGEHAAVATAPGLDERVRQQGEGPGVALHVAQQDVHEAGLEAQSGAFGGSLDRLAQRVADQRRDQVHPEVGERRQVRVAPEARDLVRADRDDDARARLRPVDERPAEALDLAGFLTEHEELLQLVDRDHGVGAARRERGLERGDRVRARHHDDGLATTAAQLGDDPGAQQRALAAARGPGQHQERRGAESVQAHEDLGVPAEEVVLVALAVGSQALVRAGRADRRRAVRLQQRRVLPEHPRLELRELRARSIPSSSDNERRARRSVASASACRPQRYCARARAAHRRSRSGSARTRDSPSPATVRWSPAASCASSRSSSAIRRISWRRSASERPSSQPTSSTKAGPLHRASARSSVDVARSGSPVAMCVRARETCSSNRCASIDPGRPPTGSPRSWSRCSRARAPSQPPDRRLQVLVPGRRWLLTPDRVGQRVDVDRASEVHHQGGEHDALPRAERTGVVETQRAEHRDAHAVIVRGGPEAGRYHDTGRIPRVVRARGGRDDGGRMTTTPSTQNRTPCPSRPRPAAAPPSPFAESTRAASPSWPSVSSQHSCSRRGPHRPTGRRPPLPAPSSAPWPSAPTCAELRVRIDPRPRARGTAAARSRRRPSSGGARRRPAPCPPSTRSGSPRPRPTHRTGDARDGGRTRALHRSVGGPSLRDLRVGGWVRRPCYRIRAFVRFAEGKRLPHDRSRP